MADDSYEVGDEVRFVQMGQTNFGEVLEVTEDDRGNPAVRVEWDDGMVTTTTVKEGLSKV